MKHKPWLYALLALAALVVLLTAFLLLRPTAPPPPVSLSPTLPLSPAPPTADWGDLPTVTPPGPGEPTVPPEALTMRAAPTATPGQPPTLTPLPPPTPTPTPEPTPIPVPAAGSDDVPMVEIPAGEFVMGVPYAETRRCLGECYRKHRFTLVSFSVESPRLIVDLPAFAIDRFPVTNARYRACAAAGICHPVELSDPELPADYADNPIYDNYPVRGVNWYDASAYCGWVGKRLPTEMEWEKAARGTDGRRYPWGNEWNPAYVTPLLSPVGQHPGGASPYGVQDMLAEGGEWTSSLFRYYPGHHGPLGYGEPSGQWPVVRGLSIGRQPFWWVTVRFKQYPYYGNKLGFRCVRGPTPPPTLDEALVRIEVPATPQPVESVDLSTMVYVPAGPFLIGYSEPYTNPRGINERANAMPLHVVYLDAFYIDRYEVTYAEYVRFLNAMGGNELACDGFNCAAIWRPGDPDSLGSHILLGEGQYEVEPGFEDIPVGYVSWYGAVAYCAWQGKRLPTEAEWEKAARGTDGRLFPWGNEWDPRWTTYVGDVHPTGSNPLDVSPYGVHDMLGNEVEWVMDWYAPDYYAYSPPQNPTGPGGGERRVHRSLGGGVDSQGKIVFGLPDRSWSWPSHPGGGFRCAYSPGQERHEQ